MVLIMHVSQTGLSICIQNKTPLQESAVYKRSFTDSVLQCFSTLTLLLWHPVQILYYANMPRKDPAKTDRAGKNTACVAEKNQR